MSKVCSSSIVYEDFFKVRKDLIEDSRGVPHPYSCLILPGDAAIVLAQDELGKYIINWEYRHPMRKHLFGCPGGLLGKGEDPILGGQRELLEETGYFAEEIYLTGCAYPFPGICDQKIYYLWAKNAKKKQAPELDPLEAIETKLMSKEELLTTIRSHSNIDAILCTALWFQEQFLQEPL